MNNKPLVAVIRGGYSGESIISFQSAERMFQAIDTAKYNVVFLTIKEGEWSCASGEGTIHKFDPGKFTVERGNGSEQIGMALIAIHGSPGEDGKLQGMLDILKIPYQTGDVLSMAVTFSKYATVALLKQQGFPVAPSVLIQKHSPDIDTISRLGFPVFVKPDRSGSSLGVSKVKRQEELLHALDLAFAECDQVLVEGAVTGRELTCGVIRSKHEVTALPICEIKTSREFFDYEAKYHSSDTQEIIPAELPDHITRMVQQRSAAIYKAFNCRGMVRVDHFWTGGDDEGSVVTIELNTVPGFSGASIFPKMLEAKGISIKEAVNALVEDALALRVEHGRVN